MAIKTIIWPLLAWARPDQAPLGLVDEIRRLTGVIGEEAA
jgi:hypothetical protein